MYGNTFFPFLLLTTRTVSLKVFNFDNAHSTIPGLPLSSATITNGQSFPDNFVVCFSIKMTKLDGLSPFILYGENRESWLAFSFWDGDTGPMLWAQVQGSWVKFHTLEKPWTHVWKHICADVDPVRGNITVSLMGREAIIRCGNTLKSNKPRHVAGNVVIGLDRGKSWDNLPLQFSGSVTNINIYSASKNHTIEQLSMNASKNGNILAWTDITFVLEGLDVTIDDIDIETANTARQVLLPVKTDWHEGARYCRYLGRGQIAGIENQEELNKTAELVKELMKSCKLVWLPVSDEFIEGDYRNTNNGNIETYLPWGPFKPDGGTAYNYVALHLDKLKYYDQPAKRRLCVSCAMAVTALFRLRGQCQDSYMGKLEAGLRYL